MIHLIWLISNFIKDTFKNYPSIYHVLRRLYHLHEFWLPKRVSIQRILEDFSINNHDIYFIQIGANNGIDRYTNFRRLYNWHSILVEPQKEVFEELKRHNYQENGILFENVAISNETCTKKLYKFSLSSTHWATGIASFDKEHIIGHIKPGGYEERAKNEGITIPQNPDDYITFEEVECITLKDLMFKRGLKKLDILAIDTEGHDFEIIKSIDFTFLKPKIIVFEFVHLKKGDFSRCMKILKANSYKIFVEDIDIIAIY